jgi:sulfite reductase (ferredoxin)
MTDAAPVVKETKAQRQERLKRELNPWEAFDQVRAFAREGRQSVTPEWAGAYFKWWGIYTQGDGAGALGGKGGEGVATEYFMMRIGIPNGIVNATQLRVIADITKKHARNLADITVRQNIQLHWLTIEDIPEVVRALDAVGLSPKGACGDVVRNVTGCPLAGVAHDELIDSSALAISVAHELTANPDFYNLPRKFKISITGCPVWCSYPEINDIGLTAVKRSVNGQDEVGYSIRVGGGLSKEPHLAVKLPAFIQPSQAQEVIRAVAGLFRDQQGLRESRDRARLKYLFIKEGWDAEKFLAEIENRIGYKLDPPADEVVPDDILRDHAGINPQRNPDLRYVGASVLRGRLSGDQLAAIADLSEKYGTGDLRCTVMQNFIIVNVPKNQASDLARALEAIDIKVDGTPFWRGAIACTGTEFCKLAITETKGFTRWLVDEMEDRLPAFDQQFKLHVTGCPNSCGQHWIADIGLEGKKIKHEGRMVDAFYFCVGGAVGLHANVARPIGYRCPADEVPASIERLLRGYLGDRNDGENLRAWFTRQSDENLRAQAAGAPVDPIERDKPEGRVPHGVGD